MSEGSSTADRTAPAGRHRPALVPVVVLALVGAAIHTGMAAVPDLRANPGTLLVAHAALLGVMGMAWRCVRRGGAPARNAALAAALLFRLIAVAAPPSLSDDVFRYVWDGRVQLHGIHPYRHAPDDPALAFLRDADWARINHPETKTIYPPLAQMLFLTLSAVGAGPYGFKLAMGLLDFGVVLALGLLLRRLGLPGDRLVLYAWNPLAVLETAGSGHVESLGVLLVVLAAVWIIGSAPGLSTTALACAVQAKLLPAVLVPAWVRRLRSRHLITFAVVTVVLAAPYALWGPAFGGGLLDYAGRWERNALVFPLVRDALERADAGARVKEGVAALQRRIGEGIVPWNALYRHVWPDDLARALCASAALAWIVHLAFRPGLHAARETHLALGGVLLLAPTLHPWYLLWILPFAAAFLSRGWILLAALVPLAYAVSGEVPWNLRAIEYAPAVGFMTWDTVSAASARAKGRKAGVSP